MVDDSYAAEVRDVKAEQKQVGQAHKKAQGVVHGLESKLDELRQSAQDALRALDAADRILASSTEACEVAREALDTPPVPNISVNVCMRLTCCASKPTGPRKRPKASSAAVQATKRFFSGGWMKPQRVSHRSPREQGETSRSHR